MKKTLYMTVMGLFMLSGCIQPYDHTQVIDSLCLHNAPDQAVFEIVKDVLRKMHFTIDKADPNSGYIRTHPLPGAQTFEFWRKDNIGIFNTTEANLHSIQRTVEISVTQEQKQTCVSCSVYVKRLNVPQQKVISTAQAYRILSESTTTIQRLTFQPEQQKAMQWKDMGLDPMLAKYILKQFKKTASKKQLVIAKST